MRKELSETFVRVFMHAGYVDSLVCHWATDKLVHIEVSFLPWSSMGVEEVTGALLEAGHIQDESYRYIRIPGSPGPVDISMTIDLTADDWQKRMAAQVGVVIGNELRRSFCHGD